MLADDRRSIEAFSGEFKYVKDVLLYSVNYDELEMSKAAWNTDVYMPLLRLTLYGLPTLRACNVYVPPLPTFLRPGLPTGANEDSLYSTTARLCRELLYKTVAGEETKAKIIDFSINLLADSEPEVKGRIVSFITTEPIISLWTINQSLYKPLYLRLLALYIETKGTSGGTDGLEARS
jgi:hypothetical protein